jgi:hypothetical protein
MSHKRGPSPEQKILKRFQREGGSPPARDMTPAVGTRGEPSTWSRAAEDAAVAGARADWADARWSYLYKQDTRYRDQRADDQLVWDAARRMRSGADLSDVVQGPFIHPAVWTWEVPLYFWFGGIATGSSFVAVAADLVGDHASAATSRKVALAAVLPSAPLLVLDLGRPLRFLHMLRIFKPRSPMSMGAWCLTAFTNAAGAAVAADLLGQKKTARALGATTAALGGYLGSYTGVLLASTAIPLWSRSRAFLPPMFMATATATGAAASRLALAATGLPTDHPTQNALGTIEIGAMAAELALSTINERRLGPLRKHLELGTPGKIFKLAKTGVLAGSALRLAGRPAGPTGHHLASLLYLASGLAFRFAWVGAGRTSASDDAAVARAARPAA